MSRTPSSAAERSDPTPVTAKKPGRGDPTPTEHWIRFGDWLVRRGLISRSDLFCALHRVDSGELRLGDALVAEQVIERAAVEQEAQAFSRFQVFLRSLRA
jgi:hypothetical protein